MAFFPDQYKVFISESDNQIILSARISEDVAETYFLSKDQCLPFTEATDFSSWSGSDSIMAKIANNEATLALRTSEGVKYYRSDAGTLLVMQAQMRTSIASLSNGVSDSGGSAAHNADINIDYEYIRQIIKFELSMFKAELIADLAQSKPREPIKPTLTKTLIKPPSSVYVPSKITNSNLEGNINIESSKKDSDIENALEALKNLRKQGEKK